MSASYRGKRAFDLLIVLLASVPTTIIGVFCALAIKLTSRGPIFFTQERIGQKGEPFRLVKFRTMLAGENPIFPDDSRITRVGALFRRLSLDELPQLLNVVRGEMSIVGPRPTLGYQVERYDDRQRRRLLVKPGVTGLAQLKGRNLLTWSERIELDLEYLDHQSPWLDLTIVVGTVFTTLIGKGAEGHPVDDPIAQPPGHMK